MDQIEKIFYDNYGLDSQKSLIKKIKEIDKKVPTNDIINWYKSQSSNQVLRLTQKQDIFHPIIVPSIGYIDADLMDYSIYSKDNNGYNYILTVIDIYSRYVWAYPLKTKSPNEIIPYINEVNNNLIVVGQKWITFTSDQGSEFMGPVKKFMVNNNIPTYIAIGQDKLRAAHIESFNRTLNIKITKATYILKTTNWVNILQQIIFVYNNTIHSAIKQTPFNVLHYPKNYKPDPMHNIKLVEDYNIAIAEQNLNIGDFVRVAISVSNKKDKLFIKRGLRGENTYSEEIYQIVSRNKNKFNVSPISDFIKSEKGVVGSYLPRYLLKVKLPTTPQNYNFENKIQDELVDLEKIKRKSKVAKRNKLLMQQDDSIDAKNVIVNKRKPKKPVKFDI
jgi:hypothetical protein